MCYHKSLVAKYESLIEHYSASFDSIISELYLLKDRFSALMTRAEKDEPYSKEEVKELKNLQKIINTFTDAHYKKYYENGFDFLPSPIITAGTADEFKFFNWGLVPFYITDR